WEISREGSNLHAVFPNSPAHLELFGKWAADGSYYVFNRDGNVWFQRETSTFGHKEDSAPVQLTIGPMRFLFPTPSLDSKRIFTVGSQPRGELVRYDPASRQFLSFLSGISAHSLDFSRDGQWVVYVTHPEGVMWRSRIDGSDRMQLSGSLHDSGM